MFKTDLVAAVAAQTGLPKDKADAVVSAVIEQITNALSRKESVALLGFGSFTTGYRAERSGRNPRTGHAMTIGASNTIVFRPGAALRSAVNPN